MEDDGLNREVNGSAEGAALLGDWAFA